GRAKIHLTPSDLNLLHLEYPQRGLLFPKPDPETRFISRLKSSLSTALEIYFPFAGRLVKVENQEDKTVSFYINCDEVLGAKFVHAIAKSVSVSDVFQLDGSVPNFFRDFFLAFLPRERCQKHQWRFRALACYTSHRDYRRNFISFGYNHLVADGSSMRKFIHTWSKIYFSGQKGNLDQPNVFKGWFLDMIDFPIHIPIWRHSGLNREEETRCMVAADFRQRLNPPLEKECFGNVTLPGITTATVGGLADRELGWAPLQISKTVRSQTNENYKTFAETWVRNIKIPRIDVVSRIGDNSLIVNNSPWFEVYENDFGLGKPIAIRAGPANGIGDKLVVFRGIEEGSIDVHVILTLSLWSDVLVNLLDDVESMENVTTT
ncbi:hypothetical protein EUTSA_v10011048mg, partial [Eutrema salsugineum]